MTVGAMVWWLAGNALLLVTIVVASAAELRAIRRGRKRMADFQHAFTVLVLHIRDTDPGRALPLAVTEYLKAYNTPQRRRRRAL